MNDAYQGFALWGWPADQVNLSTIGDIFRESHRHHLGQKIRPID